MKRNFLLISRIFFFLLMLLILLMVGNSSYGQTQIFTATGTFTVPPGVTSVTVECWGGGGAGGGNTANSSGGGGGGAGGAYARSVVTVVPGNNYTVTVAATKAGLQAAGSKGNPSWFGTTGTVYAEGGAGGAATTTATAPGGIGSSANSIGDFVYPGGNGANGTTTIGGAGGGGAGSSGAGGNATGITAGNGTTIGGGNGGAGRNSENNGNAGNTYGGGGGGAFVPDNTDHSGGSGAAGQVVVSWTPPIFYSQNSGNPGTLTNWNTNPGGGGYSPASFTSNYQTFVVQSGHNMSTTGTWTVSGTNTLVQITNGGSIIANNTVSISSLTVNNGGTYVHNVNGGTIPTATWNAASNCNITGITNTAPGGLNQSFGNFTWNCVGQTATVYLQSDLNINGNFSVLSTNGTVTTGNSLRISNTATSYSVTVGGNYIQNNGVFKLNNSTGAITMTVAGNLNLSNGYLTLVTGNAHSTLSVSGDVTISGGEFDLTEEANYGTLYVGGNFSHTGGTISEINTGTYGEIIFNGTSTQTYTSGGTVSFLVNFMVNNGAVLQMANAGTTVMGGGTFTVANGGTLGITSPNGITTTGATGNIQVTGTRTFNTGANYTYNGTVAQNTGNGLPSIVNNLTINNNTGVTLSNSTTVNGTLNLTNGILTTGANTITVTNNSTSAVTGGSTTNFINGPLIWTLAPGSTYVFPIGKGTTYLPFGLTGITGTAPQIRAEAFSGSTGGTANSPLGSLSNTEYWWSSVASGTYTTGSVSLTRQSALAGLDAIGRATTLNGAYSSLNGTVSGTSIINSAVTGNSLGYFVMAAKRTITTGTIAPTTYCAGASVSVPYTITGIFNAGNVFTAQLSDASGSFTTPVILGTSTSTSAGTISGTIPAGTVFGTGYRIRVVSSDPSTTGTDNGTNITINAIPQGSLSANGPICVSGAGQLTWTATAGTGPYTVIYNDGTANRTQTNVTSGTAFNVFTNPVTSTTTYTLVSVTGTGCSRNSGFTAASATITVNSIPSAPSTTSGLICIGSTATLSASGAAPGGVYKWYDAATNGNLLKTSTNDADNTFTTPVLGATTNYWVSIVVGSCESSRTQVTATFPTVSTDSETASGANTWIGHVYDGTGLNTYYGSYTEPETFDQSFGGNTNCFSINSNSTTRTIYTETFSVRYRLNSTKKGLYVADLGSDDGTRLTVDGTLVYNNWADQAFSSRPGVLMNLNGASSLVYEYYENGGGNQVVFTNFTQVIANNLTANTTQSLCIGMTGPAIGGDIYGTLPTGITLSGTGYQWTYSTTPAGVRINISGATGATYAPNTTIAPFNTPGTYYIYRNAVLSSANNVSPNPYVATNESNAATVTINALPTVGITGSPSICIGATTTLSPVTGGTWASSNTSWATVSNSGVVTGVANGNPTFTFTQTSTGCSSITSPVTVVSPVSAAGAITGTASVTQGQSGVAYSVPVISGAVSYIWSYSGTGATINGTSNSITINFSNNATSGILTVRGTNACGNGAISANYPIAVAAIPNVSFTTAAQSSATESGTMTVTVQMSYAIAQAVTIPFAVTGTATGGGTDYTITASPITIAAGNTTGTATITITADALIEGNETVILTMGTPTNAVKGVNTIHTATITDEGSIAVNPRAPENTYTPTQLVQNVLVKGCLSASNVTFKGGSAQIGHFTKGGSTTFPISEGIILSTGNVADAVGPNKEYNTTTEIGSAGDTQLNTAAGITSQDAAVLEFDFVPAGNTLQFNYIFASEEYLESVGQAYNDAFAFFLSGPGISGSVNLALIPGTNTPVSISNVHGQGYTWTTTAYPTAVQNQMTYPSPYGHYYSGLIGGLYTIDPRVNNANPPVNGAYYVDNGHFRSRTDGTLKWANGNGGPSMEFDGRTTLLTASRTVTPCSTYHIKLVVADAGDRKWDSGVFLEARSFTSNEIQIQNLLEGITGDKNEMYEGCDGSFIRFLRASGTSTANPLTFNVILSGTAQNGVDYVYTDSNGTIIGDGTFPSVATIPAGQTEVSYYYKAQRDGNIEGNETIVFQVDKSCPCDVVRTYFEKVVNIIDVPQILTSSVSVVQCPPVGNPVAVITVNMQNGLNPNNYQFSFDGGAFQSSNVYTITASQSDGSDIVGTSHDVVVRDQFSCNQVSENNIVVPPITIFQPNAGSDIVMCEGQSGTHLNASGGVYYVWSSSPANGVNYLSSTTIANPTVINTIPAGIYTFTVTAQDQQGSNYNCQMSDAMVLTVNQRPTVTATIGSNSVCNGSPVQLNASVTNGGSNPTYLWSPSINLSSPNIVNPIYTPNVSQYQAQAFTVTVTGDNGCQTSVNSPIVEVNPSPLITTGTIVNATCGASNGSATVTASSPGTSPVPQFTYSWNTSPIQTTPTASNLAVGTYTVTVNDVTHGCTNTKQITIITASDITPPTVVCQNISVTLDGTGNAVITPAQINNGSTDNCTASGSLLLSLNKTTFNASNVSTNPNTLILTATDAAGNSSSCNATVTVVLPANCSAVGSRTIYREQFDAGSINGGYSIVGGGSAYAISGTVMRVTQNTSSSNYFLSKLINISSYTNLILSVNATANSGNLISTDNIRAQYSYDNITFSDFINNNPIGGNTNGTICTSIANGTNLYIKILVLNSATNKWREFDNVTLSGDPSLQIAATITNVTCNGLSNGQIVATGSVAPSPYQYKLNVAPYTNYQSSGTFTGLPAGNYIITVKDNNGVENTKSVTVTQPSTDLSINTAKGVSNAVSCYPAGGNVIFTITNADNGIKYELNTSGNASLSPPVIATGTGGNLNLTLLQANVPASTITYKVLATSASGCSSAYLTAQPILTVYNTPAPTGATSQSFCSASAKTINDLSVTGNNILWYNQSSGGSVLPGTTLLVNGNTYYASQTLNGCESSTRLAVMVSVVSTPSIFGVTHGIICGTGTATLQASAVAETITWHSAETGGSVLGTGTSFTTPTISTTTSYWVDASNNGCVTPIRSQVYATVHATPAISLGSEPVVCRGNTSANLSYSSPQGSPNRYSINFDGTAESAGFLDVVDAVLPASPITIVVPGAAPVGVYHATISVKNLANGCTGTSYPITLTVSAVATITVQPTAPAAVCEGAGVANFSVTATGGGLTYQWYVDGTTPLTGVAPYSGTTSSTLTITDPPISLNGKQYSVKVLGPCGSQVTSNAVALNLISKPIWTGYNFPSPISLCLGGTVSFSVSVTGGLGGTITWIQSSSSGGSGTTVTTGDSPAVGTWYYRPHYTSIGPECTLADGIETTVTVVADPTLSQPSDVTICKGGNTTLTTTPSGGTGSFSYQWQYCTTSGGTYSNVVNGTPTGITYTNGTTASLTITGSGSEASAAKYYKCLLTTNTPTGAGCNAMTSAVTVTTVDDPTLSVPTALTTLCKGGNTTVSTSVTAGGTGTYSYQWQYSANGTTGWVNVADATPAGITYSGNTTTSLTVTGNGTEASSSKYYRCVLTSTTASVGCDQISATAQITTVDDPTLSVPTALTTLCKGGNTTVSTSVTAGGTGTYSYQWQYSANGTTGWVNVADTAPAGITYSGNTTTSLTVTGNGTEASSSKYYRCVLTSTTASVGCDQISATAQINTVDDPTISVNPVTPPAACVGGTLAALTVTAANGTPSLTYQWYSNTTNSTIGGTSLGSGSGAQTNSYTPPTATAGTLYYYCVVSSSGSGCGNATSTTAMVVIVPDITITTQPNSPADICEGETSANMTIAASNGTPSLTYQWQYKNGSNWNNIANGIPAGAIYTGATGTSFSVAGISTAGAYQYQCMVSATGSGCGSAISNVVTVTVNPRPGIANKTVTTCSETIFTVTPVNGTEIVPVGTTYSWAAPVVTGISGTLPGSNAANISGTLTNATNAAIDVTYTVTPLSGSCTGSPFTVVVTVNPRPGIANKTVTTCSETIFTVTPVNGTDIVPVGTTYSWAAPVVTGISGTLPGSNAANISGILTNLTNAAIDVTYTVTPLSGSCTGSPFTVVVTVSPKPGIANKTVTTCSETIFTVTPVNGTDIVPVGTTYSWAAPVVTGISGTLAGSNAANISGILTNLTNAAIDVTYTVTPLSGSCTGSPFTVVVTVSPKPGIANKTVTTCSETIFTVTPVNGTDIVPVGTTYSWAAPVVAGISGTLPGSNAANISGTLTNATNAAIDVTYTVTPLSGSCTGSPFTVVVTVSPKPGIANKTVTTCSGTIFTVTPVNGTDIVPVGTTYSWAAPVVTGISGTFPGSNAANISGTLTNLTNAAIDVTYTVTPLSGSCTGSPFTVVVTVSPKPGIANKTVTTCSGTIFTVTPVNGTDIVPVGTTYSWAAPVVTGISGTLAGSNAANISGTLTNLTNAAIDVTYTITPLSGSCTGSPFTVVVTVSPKPGIANKTVTTCSGTIFTVAPVNWTDIVPVGTTYSWAAPVVTGISGTLAGSNAANISGTLTNLTNAAIDVTYTVTPLSGSCTGSPFTVVVTVSPKPGIANKTVTTCSGTIFTIAPVNGTDIVPVGTTYSWAAPVVAGISGTLAGSNAANISGTLTNLTNAAIDVTYTVTPLSGSCTGSPFTVVVTVSPKPGIANKTVTICSETIFTVTPVNGTDIVPVGTTYSWAAPVVAGISGTLAGSNAANISATLTNATNAAIDVVYTVTPTSSVVLGSCTGPSFTVTVKVNPKPAILAMSATICSEGTFTVEPVSGTNGIVPASTLYSWLAPSVPGITGITTGSAALNISGTLVNTTNAAIDVVYTVTPTSSIVLGSCTGPSFTVTVKVNPKPAILAMSATICSEGTFTVEPVSGTNGIVPVATLYSWLAPSVPGITGITPGSAALNISATLVNTTNAAIDVVYTVTPTSSVVLGSCTGPSFTVTVKVNPKPAILAMSATICSEGTFTVEPVSGTNGIVPAATLYSWLAPSVPGITGITPGSAALNISGTLVNTTNAVIDVVYTVTPTSSVVLGSCTGPSFTVTVKVNPKPAILAMSATICSEGTFTVEPVSGTNGIVPASTLYSWLAPSVPGITGITTGSAALNISGTLVNTTNAAIDVVYTVTPTSSIVLGSCTGPSFTVTVKVNPKPAILAMSATICSEGTFTVEPVSGTNGIVPAATLYSWLAPSVPGITGITTGSAALNISGTLVNTTNAAIDVVYTVTPTSSVVLGSCTGPSFTVTVKVNPKPAILAMSATICSEGTFTVEPVSGTNGIVPAATLYSWLAPSVPGITGITPGSGALNISGTLVNTTNAAIDVIYTVTPTSSVVLGSCTGPSFTVTVKVNPKPAIIAMTATICSAGSFNVLPINGIDGNIPLLTVYSWPKPTVTEGLSGEASGNLATSITGTLVNSTNNLQTATYTVTPTSGSCNGNTFLVTIKVNPDGSWTGGAHNNDWDDPLNWACNKIPLLTTNVIIGNNRVPYPIILSGEVGKTKNLTIENIASVTVEGTLQIAGAILNAGTFTATAGTIEMKGNSVQSINGSVFSGNTIMNLTNSNPAGTNLTGPLNVTGIVLAANGDLSSDGNLTLISTAGQTALIDGTGSGEVLGYVNMQRYLPSAFGYKYFSSPFQGATVSEFAEEVNLSATFPTFYKYDENNSFNSEYTSGWVKYIEPFNPLVPLAGYSANFGSAPAAAKTVSMTGVVNNGNLPSITLLNNNRTYTQGFNLVGNPYPSPIDWNASTGWNKTNIDNAIYFFNASSQYSGYYSSYINGTSTSNSNNIIAAMQGFFVHVSDGGYPVTGTLGVSNAVRINDLNPSFKNAFIDNRPILRFTANFETKNAIDDAAVIYFDETANLRFDKEKDALKMKNSDFQVPNLYSLTPDSTQLSINGMPFPSDSISSIPLGINTFTDGWIKFKASDISQLPSDMFIYLVDAEAGKPRNLKQLPEYRFYLKTGEYNQRFKLVFSLSDLSGPMAIGKKMFELSRMGNFIFIKINLSGSTKGNLMVTNMLGQVILRKEVFGQETVKINQTVSAGVYVITLTSGNKTESEKILIRKDYE